MHLKKKTIGTTITDDIYIVYINSSLKKSFFSLLVSRNKTAMSDH